MRWARRYRVWLGVATAAAGLAAWLRCGALPPGMLDLDAQVSTQVVARDGEPLRESLSADGQRSRLILAGRLPDALLRATLAAEDARFFRHPGLDPLAIARAVVHDLSARRFVEGGSTLTQQVVKVLTRRQRTAGGKLREAVAYFGTGVFNLTPAQAALLASLPQRPTALDPYRHLDAALQRQRWVLERMRTLGFLSEDDYRAACVERLAIVRTERAFLAPHFALRVLAEVPGPPPRRLETTLDAALQRDVAGIVDMHRARLLAHGAHNVAVAVLDNRTSEWRAWEGSGDYAPHLRK